MAEYIAYAVVDAPASSWALLLKSLNAINVVIPPGIAPGDIIVAVRAQLLEARAAICFTDGATAAHLRFAGFTSVRWSRTPPERVGVVLPIGTGKTSLAMATGAFDVDLYTPPMFGWRSQILAGKKTWDEFNSVIWPAQSELLPKGGVVMMHSVEQAAALGCNRVIALKLSRAATTAQLVGRGASDETRALATMNWNSTKAPVVSREEIWAQVRAAVAATQEAYAYDIVTWDRLIHSRKPRVDPLKMGWDDRPSAYISLEAEGRGFALDRVDMSLLMPGIAPKGEMTIVYPPTGAMLDLLSKFQVPYAPLTQYVRWATGDINRRVRFTLERDELRRLCVRYACRHLPSVAADWKGWFFFESGEAMLGKGDVRVFVSGHLLNMTYAFLAGMPVDYERYVGLLEHNLLEPSRPWDAEYSPARTMWHSGLDYALTCDILPLWLGVCGIEVPATFQSQLRTMRRRFEDFAVVPPWERNIKMGRKVEMVSGAVEAMSLPLVGVSLMDAIIERSDSEAWSTSAAVV
jgi:hypothetical protein